MLMRIAMLDGAARISSGVMTSIAAVARARLMLRMMMVVTVPGIEGLRCFDGRRRSLSNDAAAF